MTDTTLYRYEMTAKTKPESKIFFVSSRHGASDIVGLLAKFQTYWHEKGVETALLTNLPPAEEQFLRKELAMRVQEDAAAEPNHPKDRVSVLKRLHSNAERLAKLVYYKAPSIILEQEFRMVQKWMVALRIVDGYDYREFWKPYSMSAADMAGIEAEAEAEEKIDAAVAEWAKLTPVQYADLTFEQQMELHQEWMRSKN